MAALFDTTIGVLLLRRQPRADAGGAIDAARAEISEGSALLPASAASELLVGERHGPSLEELSERLSRIPTVILPVEAASWAGSMGSFLAS